MRWLRLDTLRFWSVESWGQTTVASPHPGPSCGPGRPNMPEGYVKGLEISFKMLADVRAKLQHDQEVPL